MFLTRELDADERPERPIPSGRISKSAAIALGLSLLLIGVLSASLVNFVSAGFALVIALCALIYDYKAKHSVIFGPLFMGLCRSGNLLLGMSIIPLVIFDLWPLSVHTFILYRKHHPDQPGRGQRWQFIARLSRFDVHIFNRVCPALFVHSTGLSIIPGIAFCTSVYCNGITTFLECCS
jgi:hypothetical protein